MLLVVSSAGRGISLLVTDRKGGVGEGGGEMQEGWGRVCGYEALAK